MGYAIAAAALAAGHEVTLVSGPVCLAAPAGARLIPVTTCDGMFDIVQQHVNGADVLVMCAAPADFKPAHFSPNKIKKQNGPKEIALVPTRDILSSLVRPQKKILIVGFAAETESLAANAVKKLRDKNCDLIVGNDVSRMDTGMESDYNAVTLFYKNETTENLERQKKTEIAAKLVEIFARLSEKV